MKRNYIRVIFSFVCQMGAHNILEKLLLLRMIWIMLSVVLWEPFIPM